MAFKLTIGQKGILLVALPSFFQVIFVIVLSGLLHQAEAEAKKENHAKTVVACANTLMRIAVDSVMTAASLAVNKNDAAMKRAEFIMGAANHEVERLKGLVKDNPPQMQNANNASRIIKVLFNTVSEMKDGGPADLRSFFGERTRLQRIRVLAFRMDAELNKIIEAYTIIDQHGGGGSIRTRNLLYGTLLCALVFNVSLGFILAYYFSQSVAKRLLVVRENTSRLARRQSLVPAIGGDDEIAELDQAFHKTADELEELEQFKQQLIGIVSHELKTPLSAMQVNIALMRSGISGELPPKAQQKVKVLETDVNRLIRLINDLLDIEKLESGKFDLIIRPCDLCTVVETALESVRGFAESKEVELKSLVREKDFILPVDYDRLVQVVINLLSNAVKYSPANSEVIVSVRDVEDYVELSVQDRGRGIPEGLQDKVFDRFQQVEKSDETEKGGTGLGLAICKAIIEQHGGTIGVDSKFGEGSKFWCRLKKAKLLAEDKAPTAISTMDSRETESVMGLNSQTGPSREDLS